MNETESCTQESIGKGRKRVAGSRKNTMKKAITGRKIQRMKVKNGKA